MAMSDGDAQHSGVFRTGAAGECGKPVHPSEMSEAEDVGMRADILGRHMSTEQVES